MWATHLRIVAVVLGTIGLFTVVCNAIPQVQSEVPQELSLTGDVTPEQLVAAGEQLYAGAGGCTACHGLGTRAPNLLTDDGGKGQIGARCGSRKPGMDCKAYLKESMESPNAFVVPGFQPIMPDIRRTLSEGQIWALVAYLESLGGEVTVTADDVTSSQASEPPPGAAGPSGPAQNATLDPQELITQHNCAACHQLNGQGGAIGPSFDGMGGRRSADAIRRGILEPNADTAQGYAAVAGVMPATFGSQLTAAQLEALVRFLANRK
jgi:mono/diheme cytochrome c family protein